MSQQPTADPGTSGFSRRRLLAALAGFSIISTLTMIVAPILGFLIPPKTSGAAAGGKVLVGTVADIPPGQGKVVPVGSSPTIIVNTDQGLNAFSAICPHLGCIVTWDPGSNVILCPCHDGRFNPTTGAVLSGPPPSGLPAEEVTVEDDQIFVVSS
ncbi:MAG: Rieske (2Fe-2S) protein [Chloroflexota bacterium]|jgi:cytochrome b6-f complex iron-sulfur subunit|nr:Rieske (2Fe-2S) protein [Chloroflexota bacterium]MDH5243238.1 Rieske (2Fe-2S) protein [Chloroflexota bacterium]